MGNLCCKKESAKRINTSIIKPMTVAPQHIPTPKEIPINQYNKVPNFEIIIDVSTTEYSINEKEQQFTLKQIANKFINGLCQFIQQQHQINESDDDINETANILHQISESNIVGIHKYKGKGLLTLGLVLQFIMINRPHFLSVIINPQWFISNDDNNDYITFGVEQVDTFFPDDLINIQGPPFKDIIYDGYVEIIRSFHLHCHFYDNGHSEALGLHIALDKHLNDSVKSKSILYRKNGPHNGWNWQIYIKGDDVYNLAKGVCFMSVNKQKGSYLLFHARTYDKDIRNNEWSDHAVRLAWIGVGDTTQKLDVDFFHDNRLLKQQQQNNFQDKF